MAKRRAQKVKVRRVWRINPGVKVKPSEKQYSRLKLKRATRKAVQEEDSI